LKSIYIIIHIVINNNVYGGNKNMKTNIILIALFVAAFMFPSMGSVDTADAETDTSHCTVNGVISGASHDECVAAAHEAAQNALPAGALETAGSSATFDDTLMQGQSPPTPPRVNQYPILQLKKRSKIILDKYEEGAESNERSGGYGTSYRHELRENNRMRNGIPGSGRKMK
jgi:hypothetical protein